MKKCIMGVCVWRVNLGDLQNNKNNMILLVTISTPPPLMLVPASQRSSPKQ